MRGSERVEHARKDCIGRCAARSSCSHSQGRVARGGTCCSLRGGDARGYPRDKGLAARAQYEHGP